MKEAKPVKGNAKSINLKPLVKQTSLKTLKTLKTLKSLRAMPIA
jgi:hypothetical protein